VNDVDYGWCLISYDNGAVGSVCSCMFGTGQADIAAAALGTEGSLYMSVDQRTIALHRGGDEPDVIHLPEGTSPAEYGHWGTYEEIADFVACVGEGRRPLVDGSTGMRAVALCLAFEKSVRQGGQAVPMPARD